MVTQYYRAGDDELRDFVEDEVLELLARIEHYREKLDDAGRSFQRLLAQYPFLRERWCEFTRAGGLSSREFNLFINGGMPRRRPIRQKRHLRLIADKEA